MSLDIQLKVSGWDCLDWCTYNMKPLCADGCVMVEDTPLKQGKSRKPRSRKMEQDTVYVHEKKIKLVVCQMLVSVFLVLLMSCHRRLSQIPLKGIFTLVSYLTKDN